MNPAVFVHNLHPAATLGCLLSAHVDDIKRIAPRDAADPLLAHLNQKVSQCKDDCGSSRHTGIQHDYSPGVVLTNPYVYVGSTKPILGSLLVGKEDDALGDAILHEACRSVLGSVAWTLFSRAELVAYVQALQRRARAPWKTRLQAAKHCNGAHEEAQVWIEVGGIYESIAVGRFHGCRRESPTGRTNRLGATSVGSDIVK